MTEETKKPAFKIEGFAELVHLNIRKEGGDEKIVAVDAKLHIQKLPDSICDFFDDKLKDFLWLEGNHKPVRNFNMEGIRFLHLILGCTVECIGRTFHGCSAKKFQITPKDGGFVNLDMSLTLYPNPNDVSALADAVQEAFVIRIFKEQMDMFESDSE